MVKDHSDSERRNLLPPHRLLFPISSKGSYLCIIPDRIPHTMAFVTTLVEHWLEQEIAQWVYHEGSIRNTLLDVKLLYIQVNNTIWKRNTTSGCVLISII